MFELYGDNNNHHILKAMLLWIQTAIWVEKIYNTFNINQKNKIEE